MSHPSSRPGPSANYQVSQSITVIAMSLSKRLQQVQEIKTPAPLDFSQWSLADLEESKIDFGKQQLGRKYRQVWEDEQCWVKWFVQHYEKSMKMEHQKFLHFVSLKVERAEHSGQTVPVTLPREVPKNVPRSVTMAKAKAKSQARPLSPGRPCPWDDVEDPSVFTLIEDNIENQMTEPAGEDMYPANPLEIRVMQIENALARVMDFLEQNHAAQQPELN